MRQNSNERASERTRESAADAVRGVHAGARERFEREQVDLDKLHDRLRNAVEGQIKAAGAGQSLLAAKAAQQLEELRADQMARLRESQERERQVLGVQQSVAPMPGDAFADTQADKALSEIRDLERKRNELLGAMADEAAKLRDAIADLVQRDEWTADANVEAQQRRGPESHNERTADVSPRQQESELKSVEARRDAADATAVVNLALNRQENELRTVRTQANVVADVDRVADLNKRLEVAEERNRKQISVIQGAREEKEFERKAADTERQGIAWDRDAAALDQRLEAYSARADALRGAAKLLEQGRLELAERFLDAVKLADGGPRRSMSDGERARDTKRVDELRRTEQTRQSLNPASQFAVLDQKFSDLKPINELWERAAAKLTQEDRARLTGRELYNNALDRFKRMLADEEDATARDARALFEKDGLRFARDEQGKLKNTLPMLDDPYLRSRIDMERHSDLLRVSGQHLTKIEDKGDPLDPRNLAFQFGRDNNQMDVKNPMSDYVRQKVADRMRAAGIEESPDED